MSLYDIVNEDAKDILEGADGYTVPVLFTSPPPDNIEFGTLDPDDTENVIRGFMGDHYTQYDPDTGTPQEGLNSKISLTLKTLLDKGIIASAIEPVLKNWKVAWLDPVNGSRRDFLVDRIHPSRTLGHIVIILGEIEIT